jgi:hypothetical protein
VREKCNCTVNEQIHKTQDIIMTILDMFIIEDFMTVNHQQRVVSSITNCLTTQNIQVGNSAHFEKELKDRERPTY